MRTDATARFWEHVWRTTAVLNLLVAVLALLWFGRRHLVLDLDIKASDLVVIVLAAVTVVLAALALVLGGLAIWGFGEIRRAAVEAARDTARDAALGVAGPAAARATIDFEKVLNDTPDPTSLSM